MSIETESLHDVAGLLYASGPGASFYSTPWDELDPAEQQVWRNVAIQAEELFSDRYDESVPLPTVAEIDGGMPEPAVIEFQVTDGAPGIEAGPELYDEVVPPGWVANLAALRDAATDSYANLVAAVEFACERVAELVATLPPSGPSVEADSILTAATDEAQAEPLPPEPPADEPPPDHAHIPGMNDRVRAALDKAVKMQAGK